MTASLFCPHCGAVNPPAENTCFACGRSLVANASATYDALDGLPLLRQRYRLLRQSGTGGFGAVYKAEDRQFGNRVVAVKEMSTQGLTLEEIQEATEGFRREALLLARLSHPNLPRIYEQFEEAGHWYLVMDFIEGETLEEYLAKRGGRLPVEEALQISLQLTSVLDYLHRRQPPIVFRDLKPSNVMRAPDGKVYLIDFGIARLFKPGQTKDTIALGSPGYAAPEQYGKAQTTPRSDIFSLGALLHHLLTGVDPSDRPLYFAPLTLPCPTALAQLIERMVELDAQKRPDTMELVQHDLERLLQETTPQHLDASRAPLPGSSINPALAPTGTYPYAVPSASAWQVQIAGQGMQSAPVLTSSAQKKGSLGRVIGLVMVIVVGFSIILIVFHPTNGRADHSASPSPAVPTVSSGSGVPVNAVAWSPDNQKLAFGGADGNLELIDLPTSQQSTLKTDLAHINTLAWSPIGGYLAVGGNAGHIRIWQENGRLAASYEVTAANINALSWSPDSQRIVLASNDGTVLAVDALTGARSMTFEAGNEPGIEVAWSPNGRYIAFGSGGREVRVWESKTGKTVYLYHDTQTVITAFAWSPDSTRLASADAYGQLQIWDALTGGHLSTYSAVGNVVYANRGINALSWSPNGRYLASGSAYDGVKVWALGTPTPVYDHIQQPQGIVNAVAWSPDSKRIASGYEDDGTVQVWDALTGDHEQIYQLP